MPMPKARDYYEVLGLNKNASDDDVKKSYRKLAREHHPDMVQDSDKKAAEERFKEINEAYQVLSDPQKRKMYDQFGHVGPGYGGGAGGGPFGQGAGGQWGPFSYSYTSNGGWRRILILLIFLKISLVLEVFLEIENLKKEKISTTSCTLNLKMQFLV